MKTVKELSRDTNEYIILNKGTSELDMSINDISRNIVDAMLKEKGICFVGKVNLYGEERKKDYKLCEYKRNINHIDLKENQCNFVYNFEYDFCLPCYDKEIERMINERDKAPYSTRDISLIKAITERIYEIGGKYLFWA
jgi:hypothetical protein